MLDFWRDVWELGIARNALFAAVLTGIGCGVVGTYVVTRRISYIAGAIAHSVLGGLGAAQYADRVLGWTWMDPLYGAFAAALLSAAIIGFAAQQGAEREDTVIGAVWAVGMAIGILFMYHTPGYSQDLFSYLFGDILMVTRTEVIFTAVLDVILVGAAIYFYRPLQAVCFDEEFARLRNVRVNLYYMLMLAATAVTVVLLSMVVGLVLAIALLTLPAAIAGRFARSMAGMMVLAALVCVGFNVLGLTASYAADWPTGPTIIVLAGAVYFTSLLVPNRG